MKKTYYELAQTWRYLLIGSSVGLVVMFLLHPLLGNISGKPSDFLWAALIVGLISGGFTYGAVTNKIVTSPEGIENVYFGIKVKASWDKVERVDINSYGFVNLFFKESLFKSQFVNSLLRPLAYNRTIQLSPFMDNLATSNLLKDIASYVPNSNIPEFVVEQKTTKKEYQKVGTIGLYYFGWFMVLVVLSFLSRIGSEHLETAGIANANVISYILIISLMIGLLVNGLGLIGFNAEIADMNENDISRKARTHYLSPFVTILLSLLIGIGILVVLNSRSITVERESNFALVAMLIGAVSQRASSFIERLLFKNQIP
jgi:hypothetical protein